MDPDEARNVMRWLIATGQIEDVELTDDQDGDLNPDHGSNATTEMVD